MKNRFYGAVWLLCGCILFVFLQVEYLFLGDKNIEIDIIGSFIFLVMALFGGYDVFSKNNIFNYVYKKGSKKSIALTVLCLFKKIISLFGIASGGVFFLIMAFGFKHFFIDNGGMYIIEALFVNKPYLFSHPYMAKPIVFIVLTGAIFISSFYYLFKKINYK